MAKVVYLTIDDGPSLRMQEKVDYLHREGIPAVFFCKGVNLESRPDYAVDAIRKGFIIGNHSYDHPHFSTLTGAQAVDEILKTERLIEECYRSAGCPRQGKMFRFPFGDKGGNKYEAFQDLLHSLGYSHPRFPAVTYSWFTTRLAKDTDVIWTFNTKDWMIGKGQKTVEDVIARIDSNAPEPDNHCLGFSGSIVAPDSAEVVLMHDHELTHDHFFTLIHRIRSKGVVFDLPELQ